MAKAWRKIALVPAGLLAGLLVLEPVSRLIAPLRYRPDQAAPLFASKTYRLSDNKALVYEMTPNTEAFVDGIVYAVNGFGFRDTSYRPAKERKRRIVFVGDSLTYGWLLPLKDTYHRQLQGLLDAEGRDVEVMGLGVVGYNIVQMYHLIRDKALRLGPDLVVLQIGPNDFERTVGIKTIETTGKLALLPYHDIHVPYVIPKTAFTAGLMRRSHLFRLLNLALARLATKRDPGYASRDMFLLGQERSFRYLAMILDLLGERKVSCAAVFFPFQGHGGPDPYASLKARTGRLFGLRGVPFLDLDGPLNAASGQGLFIDGLHLTDKGNGVVALELARFLAGLEKRS